MNVPYFLHVDQTYSVFKDTMVENVHAYTFERLMRLLFKIMRIYIIFTQILMVRILTSKSKCAYLKIHIATLHLKVGYARGSPLLLACYSYESRL